MATDRIIACLEDKDLMKTAVSVLSKMKEHGSERVDPAVSGVCARIEKNLDYADVKKQEKAVSTLATLHSNGFEQATKIINETVIPEIKDLSTDGSSINTMKLGGLLATRLLLICPEFQRELADTFNMAVVKDSASGKVKRVNLVLKVKVERQEEPLELDEIDSYFTYPQLSQSHLRSVMEARTQRSPYKAIKEMPPRFSKAKKG